MLRTANQRIATVAIAMLALDQLTKQLVNRCLDSEHEKIIIPGFFKLVHWNNTGAAWSLFRDNNNILALVAVVALIVLFRSRHHFDAHTIPGQLSLGLIFGGIAGNLVDRLLIHHVTDFLYFYLDRRGSPEIYFPAFNVADSCICVGVGLMFIISLRNENNPAKPASPTTS